MGIDRDHDAGKETSDGISSENSLYLDLSLKGKWITVASTWIKKHYPCSREEFMKNVSKLMPTHIEQYRRAKHPQIVAAKIALRLCLLSKTFYERDGMIYLNEQNSLAKYDYGWIPRDAQKGDKVIIPAETMTKKQLKAAKELFRKRGWKKIDELIYEIT